MPGGGTVYNAGAAHNYQHKDWLGTARLESTVVNRTVVYDRAFAPYGEMYNNFGQTGQLNFTGDTQDDAPNNGLFDTPDRELAAAQGRWISPDPAVASWNAYAYSTNPNSEIDPRGDLPANPGYCDVSFADCGGGGDGQVYAENGLVVDPRYLGSSEFYGLTYAPVNGFATDNKKNGHWFNLYYGSAGFEYQYDVSWGTAVFELGLPGSPDGWQMPPVHSAANNSNVPHHLGAQTDCLLYNGVREITYSLENAQGDPLSGYYVTEHIADRATGQPNSTFTKGDNRNGPGTSSGGSDGNFTDWIGGLGSYDLLQTFTVSTSVPGKQGTNIPVFAVDIQGHAYGTNGIFYQAGKPAYVNSTVTDTLCR